MGKLFVVFIGLIGIFFLLGQFPSLHATMTVIANYAISWYQLLFAALTGILLAVALKI